MSKHNYSQYSKKNDDVKPIAEAPVIDLDEVSFDDNVIVIESEEVKMESVPKVEPKVESKPEPAKPAVGIVFNCTKLNVRANPSIDADVIAVLDNNSEVEIDVARSTSDWFKICTAAGVEGYCMRKFIKR